MVILENYFILIDRQLVFTIKKKLVRKNNLSFEDLKKFPVTLKKTDDNISTQFETLL